MNDTHLAEVQDKPFAKVNNSEKRKVLEGLGVLAAKDTRIADLESLLEHAQRERHMLETELMATRVALEASNATSARSRDNEILEIKRRVQFETAFKSFNAEFLSLAIRLRNFVEQAIKEPEPASPPLAPEVDDPVHIPTDEELDAMERKDA